VFTFVDEVSGYQQLPPTGNKTFSVYCSGGSSSFRVNASKMLLATFYAAEQVKTQVSYSLTEVYYRDYIIRSDIEYRNVYLVDADQYQVVQMIISLQDTTGDFGGSVLKVKKMLEGTEQTVTENYFDAESKNIIYLINGDKYTLYIDNGVEERALGDFYVDSVDLTKTLTLNDVYSIDTTQLGNITYRLWRRNATGYNDAIIFEYLDFANQTNNVSMYVYDYDNSSLVKTFSSTNRSFVYFLWSVTDANTSYKVNIHVNHSQFGQNSFAWWDVFQVLDYVNAPRSVVDMMPRNYLTGFSCILLLGIPMLFGSTLGVTAGIFTALAALLLVFWDWYPVNISVIVLALFLAVMNRLKSGGGT